MRQKMITRVDNWGFTDWCSPGQCRKPWNSLVKKTRPRLIQTFQNTYIQKYGDANMVTSVPHHQMPLTLLSLWRLTIPLLGRTAPLTSRRCLLYIYSTNIRTEYFKHTAHSPFFPLQNAVCFITLHFLVPILLFTF
jgi:hypothetical protein